MSQVQASNSVTIFLPGSKPFGLPYTEHIKNFWKWLIHIPAKDSPTDDPTGEKCGMGQSNLNSSIFLPSNTGGKSERICKVPGGKRILIPVMTVEVSDKDSGASVEELLNLRKRIRIV